MGCPPPPPPPSNTVLLCNVNWCLSSLFFFEFKTQEIHLSSEVKGLGLYSKKGILG